MDWLIKLFTREERIAGLEISDSHLRMALLQPGERGKRGEQAPDTVIKFLAEEPLAKGTIVGGSIKDSAEFLKALKKLMNRSPIKTSFVMVSIPSDGIYSKILSFPNTISGQKLKESMDLTMGFQLPDKPEDIYAGWEKVGLSKQNEVLLATILKKPINELVDILDSAGLRVVAIEFNALSVCRAMDMKDTEIVLVKARHSSGVTVFIVKNRLPYFLRVLPEQFLSSDDTLNEEVGRMADFFQTDKGDIDRTVDIGEVKILDTFAKNPEVSKNNGKWLASIGVAMRTLVPRSEDNMISLMSIGTEDAYEYHKAVTFSEFVLHIIIAVSIFFAAATFVVMMFLSSVQGAVTASISSSNTTVQQSTSTEQLQTQAQNLNNTLAITTSILRSTIDWHTVLQKLNADMIPGVTVNSIGLPGLYGTISISGVAQTRDILNSFNSALTADPFFSGVTIPITNIDQSTNLPFSATLSITNPQPLYYAQ